MPLTAYTNTFAGNPLDRAGERRGDQAWIAARLADPESLALALWNGAPLMRPPAGPVGPGIYRLAYFPAPMAAKIAGGEERLLFMGLWQERAVFALDFDGSADPTEGPLQGLGAFEELRGLALQMTQAEAAIAATAKGVFEWRRRHRFCSVCGRPSEPREGGWKRVCPACHAEHFPRTDPVVIMLAVQATPEGERCLLGRQARFPPGMWSALAGFVEPGESVEEACARELHEEAALDTLSVAYRSTQPWPYPSSLMIGLIAEVAPGEATPDQTELEAVRWFTRAQARALLAGDMDGAFAPPPLAIAHHLLKAWAERD